MLDTSRFHEDDSAPIILETLYRIAQEQLNNIEKHAKAADASVTIISTRKQISLLIKDNGIGFDAKMKRNGIGLTNIMNRAESLNGSVKITAEPGNGCLLQVDIHCRKNNLLPGSGVLPVMERLYY